MLQVCVAKFVYSVLQKLCQKGYRSIFPPQNLELEVWVQCWQDLRLLILANSSRMDGILVFICCNSSLSGLGNTSGDGGGGGRDTDDENDNDVMMGPTLLFSICVLYSLNVATDDDDGGDGLCK